MSRTASDARADHARATQTHADLLSLRALLAGLDGRFSGVATHPDDAATFHAVRASLQPVTDRAVDTLELLATAEALRAAATDLEASRIEAEEEAADEALEAGPVALTP